MKRRTWGMVWILLAVVIAGVLFAPVLAEDAKNPLALDMIILIENSQDMNKPGDNNTLDPQGLRFDAASALISMCDAQHSRATYCLFNKDLYLYSSIDTGNVKKIEPGEITLFDISIPDTGNRRQSMIDELTSDKIRNGHGTKVGCDIGKVLEAAVNAQLKDDTGNKKVIILLSSGRISISGDAAKKQASREQAIAARNLAVENGIDIYTVALKDNSAGELMQSLATRSSNYQFVGDAEGLTGVFRKFFADMVSSEPQESIAKRMDDGSSVISLEIPNRSVAEVNIILPLQGVDKESVKLYDPNGNLISGDRNKVIFNESRKFASYKLIKPADATYQLKYTTTNSDDAVIQYIFSYGVNTEVSTSAAKISKQDSMTFTAVYTEDGRPTTDNKLYDIPATLTVMNGDKRLFEQTMEVSESGDCYTATVKSMYNYGAGTYSVQVHFQGSGLERHSEPVSFALVNDGPELKNETDKGDTWSENINLPKDEASYEIKDNAWDLTDYVYDPNGDALKAEIVSFPEGIEAEINSTKSKNMTLYAKTKKNTACNGAIKVKVTDSDEAEAPELTFNIDIVNCEDKYQGGKVKFDAVTGLQKNSTCDLTLKVFDANGDQIKGDKQLPDEVTATVNDGIVNTEVMLTAQTPGVWTGSFKTGDREADYKVTAKVTVGQVKLQDAELTITSGNIAPKLKAGKNDKTPWNIDINDPAEEKSYEQISETWDLNDYVGDENGDKITFEVDKEKTTALVDYSINSEDNTLTLTTRLNTPTSGDVVVTSKDNDGALGPELTFNVNVVSKEEGYKVYKAKLDSDGRGKSKDITITLSVFDEDGQLVKGDSNLPDTVDATVKLDEVSSTLELIRGEDGKWTGILKTDDEEKEYTISAKVTVSENVAITPDPLTLNTENTPPVVVKQLSESGVIPQTFNINPFLFWSNATGSIVIEDLNDYFKDDDGDALTYTVNSDNLGDKAEVVLEGSKLTITALKTTGNSVSFVVTATDNEGKDVTSDEVRFTVASLKTTGILTLVIAAVVIAVALFIRWWIKPKFNNEHFEVYTRKSGQNEFTIQSDPNPKLLSGRGTVKLNVYVTDWATPHLPESILTAMENVSLSPAYGVCAKVSTKIDHEENGVTVKVGEEEVTPKHSCKLMEGAEIILESEGSAIKFVFTRDGIGMEDEDVYETPFSDDNGKPASRV